MRRCDFMVLDHLSEQPMWVWRQTSAVHAGAS